MIVSEKLRAAVQPTAMILTMIWFSEFFCFGIYYFIASQASSGGEAEAVQDPMLLVLGVMASLSVIAGVGTKLYIFSQKRARSFMMGKIRPSPFAAMAGKLPGIASPKEELTPEEDKLYQLAASTFQPYLISLGMINTCAIFGMVLSLIRQDISLYTPFLVAACVCHTLCYPRLHSFVEDTSASMKLWK